VFWSVEVSSASFFARAASRSANLLRARLGVGFRGAGAVMEFGEAGFCC
jgi:hypothetical protein